MSSPNDPAVAPAPSVARVVLLGNPNVGKTTWFNRLCGERHHTANFSGTTQDARVGDPGLTTPRGRSVELVDLPGTYALDLDQSEATICREVLAGTTAVEDRAAPPDAVVIVVDATNLERNLVLVGEVLAGGHRGIVILNMMDEARRRGLDIDAGRLASMLACSVVPACGRDGTGLDDVRTAIVDVLAADVPVATATEPPTSAPTSDPAPSPARHDGGVGHPAPRIGSVPPRPTAPDAPSTADDWRTWARAVADAACTTGEPDRAEASDRRTDRIDAVMLHPVLGLLIFVAVMTGLFAVIFRLASFPMDWIDMIVGGFGSIVASAMPDGLLQDLMVDGVIAGVGATVVFLPQICLLFFLLSLLEDTGYLSRASLLVDRWLRPFGLSGHAFIPLLSAHACAIPAIAACRGIPDARARLATVLAAPFMSCTARIPVYVLLTGLLFPDQPTLQAVAFTGCYVLGAGAGLLSAMIARRTVARGTARRISLELPSYRLPSLRAALLTMWDRGLGFLRKAGTVILLISIVLWWLSAFPRTEPPTAAVDLRADAAAVVEVDPDRAAELESEADRLESVHASQRSALGRLGATVQPIFEPLGYDRTLTVGVLASFAAREVFVTTMAVQLMGEEEPGEAQLFDTLGSATRDDGTTPIFTPATSWSLLVFYVFAMQCLPTLVVTAREAGGVRWALLQLGWMSAFAWIGAFIARQIALAAGGG